MPLAKPALATVAIFTFLFSWNDFIGPLLYLSSPVFTVAIGLPLLPQMPRTCWTCSWPPPRRCSCRWFCSSCPALLIQGIVMSGIKG